MKESALPTAISPAANLLRAKLFRGFADSSRLAILDVLRDGPLTVNEIVDATDLSQSNTSNHLACLFECGLVSREQRGKFVVYSLIDHRVAELLEIAERVLADIGQGIYDCTRYPEPGRRDT